jgi:hypothetical protein
MVKAGMYFLFLIFCSTEIEMHKLQGKGTDKNEKAGLTLADLAYRRAKAVKATKRALDSGKIVKKPQKKSNKSNPSRKPSSSRTEDMREAFQNDMKDKKPKQRGSGIGKKAKKSFKSKSRYRLKNLSHYLNYYLIFLGIDRNINFIVDRLIKMSSVSVL